MSSEGAAAASGDGYYYDNDDSFNFYLELWGGESLHVGIFDGTEEVSPEECGKASHKVPDPGLERRSILTCWLEHHTALLCYPFQVVSLCTEKPEHGGVQGWD